MAGQGYGVYIASSSDLQNAYCTTTDVIQFLPPNIIVEGTVADPDPYNPAPSTLATIDMDYFIVQSCSRIDSALSSIFDVPLKKINQGGLILYPAPITTIAAILAAQMIFEQRLQGADREKSDYQKEREEWAENELLMIQNGERRMIGQRSTRSSRFVRNTLWNIPKNPAEGGRSKGNGS